MTTSLKKLRVVPHIFVETTIIRTFKMRLSLSLLATLLPLIISAAKKPASGDVFSTFHTQSLSNTPIALLDKSFDRLTSLPRNYTAVVLLTAIETRYGCQLCRDYQPEWELLAKSWIKGDKPGNSKVVFGTLDFTDGRQTFQAVCILHSHLDV